MKRFVELFFMGILVTLLLPLLPITTHTRAEGDMQELGLVARAYSI